jgi:hypothetical protein
MNKLVAFLTEFEKLSEKKQHLVLIDYGNARAIDGCSLIDYHARIGIGNVNSYADCLVAMEKKYGGTV